MTESQVSPPVFTPLPDLCRLPVVLGVMLVGQLMVITYVLSLGPIDRFDWEMLALLTLYVQWIDLLTLAVLCQVRRWYSRYLFPRGLSNDASQMGDESALMRSRSVMVLYGLSFVAIIAVVVTCNTAAQWLYPVHREGWSSQWLVRDVIIAFVLGGMVLRYLFLQQQSRAEQLAADTARFDALQARMRPHFLFNTMNTIASLISYAPDDAETAVEDLAQLLRATLADGRRLVPWQQERDICEAYLRIEQLRLGDRLQVTWDIDESATEFALPPLSLQPLLENAIYHGIETQAAGGAIHISLRDTGDSVSLQLTNPIASATTGRASSSTTAIKPHNGMALNNLKARIAVLFGNDSGRSIADLQTETSAERFLVTMILPKQMRSTLAPIAVEPRQ